MRTSFGHCLECLDIIQNRSKQRGRNARCNLFRCHPLCLRNLSRLARNTIATHITTYQIMYPPPGLRMDAFAQPLAGPTIYPNFFHHFPACRAVNLFTHFNFSPGKSPRNTARAIRALNHQNSIGPDDYRNRHGLLVRFHDMNFGRLRQKGIKIRCSFLIEVWT